MSRAAALLARRRCSFGRACDYRPSIVRSRNIAADLPCSSGKREGTAGGSVTRHALDRSQNAGNRAGRGGRSPDDKDEDDDGDNDVAIIGSKAYLIGPSHDK